MNAKKIGTNLFWLFCFALSCLYFLGKTSFDDVAYSNNRSGDVTHVASGPTLKILQQDQKNMGLGDSSFYNYVTIKNTGTSLLDYVGINSTCTNDAGNVVGTGYGNTTNVAAGEETVVTVMVMDVDDCTHISSKFDSLTG